jgi:hypothetical protein
MARDTRRRVRRAGGQSEGAGAPYAWHVAGACGPTARPAHPAGATFVTGPYRREGNLLWPVLLDHVTRDMRLAWEEPFGPVLPIMRVASPEAAVAHCNASKYGLQVRAAEGGCEVMC